MPLPSNPQMKWPPLPREAAKYAEWAAWYSGDPERLIDVYAGIGRSPTPDAALPTTVPWWRFWSRQRRGAGAQALQRSNLHVPLPGDLAAVNGALLFSEEPRAVLPLAHEGATPDTTAQATEKRLRQLFDLGGFYNRLIEGAETAAAMGGVYLMPVWDKEIAPFPFMQVAQVDQALPVFRYGVLASVIFWKEVGVNGQDVLRHLEAHEVVSGKATILHGLYRGTRGELGSKIPLENSTETRNLRDEVTLPFPDLDVQYVPNMRPNRLWRSSPLGLSDYSGSEGLFDALDEVYASWMRDIRLAKGRIVVPQEYLTADGKFEVDQEVYSPLTMEPAAAQEGARSMEVVQFAIRVKEHMDTALNLTEQVVSNAGYSAQTFGLHIEGRAESGTALRIRENKTFLTQRRKGHWWRPALERICAQLLAIDKAEFSTPGLDPTLEMDIELSDAITNDPVELANTVNVLKQAQAVSTETRVKMIHPEWTQEQVKAEVEVIKDEEGIGVLPSPELPGFGTGNLPPETGES